MKIYCQRDIEDESICEVQCDHCNLYYAPLKKIVMQKKILFGFSELNSATPAFIARIKRALNFMMGAIVAFLPFIATKLHTTSEDLTTWLGLFMLVFNFVGLMFGVPVVDGQQIAAKDVTEIETGNKS